MISYAVAGKLLKDVKNLQSDSRACVRVGNEFSEWFPVGLRQGYIMSPSFFNLCSC